MSEARWTGCSAEGGVTDQRAAGKGRAPRAAAGRWRDRWNEIPSITRVIGRIRIPPITPHSEETRKDQMAALRVYLYHLVRLIVVSTS